MSVLRALRAGCSKPTLLVENPAAFARKRFASTADKPSLRDESASLFQIHPAKEPDGANLSHAQVIFPKKDGVAHKFARDPFPILHQDHLFPKLEDGVLKAYSDGEWTPMSGRWLRDLCACPECRDHQTAQRRINVLRLRHGCEVRRIKQKGEAVEVTFADGHCTLFSRADLMRHSSLVVSQRRAGFVPVSMWTSEISANPPTVNYAEIEGEGGLRTLLRTIRVYGFAFVDDMPPTPEASQALLEAVGPIRHTHYGGFYDFTSDLSSKDTAYTSEALEPHTDNTYFTDPAGLQALHLLSHTGGSGGESSLVDGFGAAAQLLLQNEAAYRTLNRIGVYAHASGNEGISIQPSQPFPTLTHDRLLGNLIQVRWNNADRAGIAVSHHQMDAWYDAAAEFDAILNDTKNQYWFQLTPGRMLIFDNWRVLHGRSAFTGRRRMCGGYINRDDFISKFRMTNLSHDEIRESTVTG